ncbi:MAG TPA: elongation factor P [Candidatus Paceibacterota bacterium]
MLAYNDVTPKRIILIDGEPYEVLTHHVFRMQQRKPVNKTKLRNLKTGSVTEYTFHQADKVEEADIESRQAVFVYNKKNEWWFHESTDKSKRFCIDERAIGDAGRFLKSGTEIDVVWFDGAPIQVRTPIKVDLKVLDAPPAVRGNTVQGGTKIVTLETGATILVPMFINEGDTIRINTETGEYVERA